MASEEQCLSELLNNATKVVEGENSQQVYPQNEELKVQNSLQQNFLQNEGLDEIQNSLQQVNEELEVQNSLQQDFLQNEGLHEIQNSLQQVNEELEVQNSLQQDFLQNEGLDEVQNSLHQPFLQNFENSSEQASQQNIGLEEEFQNSSQQAYLQNVGLEEVQNSSLQSFSQNEELEVGPNSSQQVVPPQNIQYEVQTSSQLKIAEEEPYFCLLDSSAEKAAKGELEDSDVSKVGKCYSTGDVEKSQFFPDETEVAIRQEEPCVGVAAEEAQAEASEPQEENSEVPNLINLENVKSEGPLSAFDYQESPTSLSSTEDPELESSILRLKEYALGGSAILLSISSEEKYDEGFGEISTVIDQINCSDLVALNDGHQPLSKCSELLNKGSEPLQDDHESLSKCSELYFTSLQKGHVSLSKGSVLLREGSEPLQEGLESISKCSEVKRKCHESFFKSSEQSEVVVNLFKGEVGLSTDNTNALPKLGVEETPPPTVTVEETSQSSGVEENLLTFVGKEEAPPSFRFEEFPPFEFRALNSESSSDCVGEDAQNMYFANKNMNTTPFYNPNNSRFIKEEILIDIDGPSEIEGPLIAPAGIKVPIIASVGVEVPFIASLETEGDSLGSVGNEESCIAPSSSTSNAQIVEDVVGKVDSNSSSFDCGKTSNEEEDSEEKVIRTVALSDDSEAISRISSEVQYDENKNENSSTPRVNENTDVNDLIVANANENYFMAPNLDENTTLTTDDNENQMLPLPLSSALPTISERADMEESNAVGAFDDMEFNLQNSPMLRRSRHSSDDKNRRDCRFIFEDDGSNDSEVSTTSSKSFITIRDSLDIAKHAHLFDNSDELKSDEGKETTGGSSFESSSSDSSIADWKPPPYQSSHPSKTLTHKVKKTSIKTDRERDSSRRVSFPDDDSRLITSYLEPVNPWYLMNEVSTDVISEAYKSSCERHKTRALPAVLQQIVALPIDVGGRIECLSIRNHKLDSGQCECLEEIFRRVQFHTVDFEACELDDDSAIPLFDMVEFYDSALQLNISHNNKIGNRGWQACARMMKRTPSLRILEARNTNLSEQNMPIVCKALRCGTRLHTIHLENCNLTGRPLVNLVGALRLNDTITDLYLADNRLGANDCIQLGNLVRANKTLKLLDLRNNNVQDSGCAHICKDIAEQQSFHLSKADGDEDSGSSQPGLSTLVLWNNHITVHAVPYFSLMLHANRTLETLNLGRNNLTSEGVLLLKNSLMRNRCLKRLGLQATRIGNEGAVALAECIADNNMISRIDLRENSIQVAGLLALSRSLKINTAVVQLDLDANPRAEPSTELSEQHLVLHQEIKTLCQRNQTNDHIKNAAEIKEGKELAKNLLLLSPEKRKISLTCETTHKSQEEKTVIDAAVNENKRYRSPAPSPAPSPSVSPCPSPSLSPSPSPIPSPLKNRFKVCRVTETSDLSTSILSTSAPAFLMHSSISGSLPSLVPSTRPNRFTGGGRFTVTKVQESSAFKSSLPGNRAMSSPSLIAFSENSEEVGAPTIVVSSPNKAVRGFSITASQEDVCYCANHDLKRNNSLDLPPMTSNQRTSTSSSDSNSPQDEVFVDDGVGTSASNEGTTIQRAPLASVEAGSFDSDSEDSELATQSSDSTHSDEVKIATEESNPLMAWEEKRSDATCLVKSIHDVIHNED